MKITKEEVSHIASLSRLSFEPEELDVISLQLNDILIYIEKLNGLDTSGVEPVTHAHDLVNAFRDDEVKEWLSNDEAMDNAPQSDNGQFKVPRII